MSARPGATARRIMEILDALYPAPAIPLRHDDPFTLLVCVVLSAQTTDKKVNEVAPQLFALARTPETMARLPVARIHRVIRPLGLAPQKARALRALAEALVRDHGGRVPRDLHALMALPGVGRKTALVVLAQAFGEAAFPVDTHIHRLAARWGLSRARSPAGTERDLCRIFPRGAWSKLHLQMIYFGRNYCPALRHDPRACPICSWCRVKKSSAAGGGRRGAPAAPARRLRLRRRRHTRTLPSSAERVEVGCPPRKDSPGQGSLDLSASAARY
jgi:endonuclease-3